MNPVIQQRFQERNGEWDFTTVIDGKAVKSQDLEEFKIQSERIAKESAAKRKEEEEKNREILPPEDLKLELEKLFPEEKKQGSQEISFVGLEDFNLWFLSKREEFPEAQRNALNLMVQVEGLVHQGCECKKEERRTQSQVVFQRFFIVNKDTDLIEGIKKVGGFSKVKFFLKGDAEPFLEG